MESALPAARPPRRLTRASLAEGARALADADPRLGRWIRIIGEVSLRRQNHQFSALCRSIISQQVSSSAARAVYARLLEALAPAPRPHPAGVLGLSDARLRACGLSRPKARYLRALAAEFAGGELARVKLGALPDDRVIELLTRVPGVGRWTAEMFLIFALGRPDVFSWRDLALRAGAERVAGRRLTPAQIERRAQRWSPWRSVASLYLWKVAHWQGEPP